MEEKLDKVTECVAKRIEERRVIRYRLEKDKSRLHTVHRLLKWI